MFPVTRLRRLRRTDALRSLVREASVTANDLILPIFVEEGIEAPVPIAEMPGVSRIPESRLAREIEAIARDGVRAVMLFGISHHKDSTGSDTMRAGGLMARMTRAAKSAVPELVVMTDNCFCEYTDHGHCGVLGHEGGETQVLNDPTLENLLHLVLADDGGKGECLTHQGAVRRGAGLICMARTLAGRASLLKPPRWPGQGATYVRD